MLAPPSCSWTNALEDFLATFLAQRRRAFVVHASDVDSSARADFPRVGTVQSAQVISDQDTGRSKGFGFVEMSSDAEARVAMSGKTIKRLRRPGANATLTPELTAAPPDIATCMYYTGIDFVLG